MTRQVKKTPDPTATVPQVPAIDDQGPNQAAIDAAHGSTGWNAYEVWRSRVHGPLARGYDKPDGNS
jgi:hypothetical protein